MPFYDFKCPKCKREIEELTFGEPVHCECGTEMDIVFSQVNTFVAVSDQAINAHQSARHRKWMDSDDTQAKLQSGELVIDNKAANPLSDYLDCFDVPSDL